MTSKSEKTFADLNYDCLREIFRYLNPIETFNMIGIFGSVADEAARDHFTEIKEFRIDMRFPPEYPDELLRMLGKSIKSLYMTVGYSIRSNDALRILQPICDGAKSAALTAISLRYICLRSDYIDCLMPLSQQLEVLQVFNCQLTDEILEHIVDIFVKLRYLGIYGNYELSESAIDIARQKIPHVIDESRDF